MTEMQKTVRIQFNGVTTSGKVMFFKVRKEEKIRKQYNQVPHLTNDTTWESNNNTINITNKRQEVSAFLAGYHKAATNRRKSMRNTRHKKIQMIYKRSTALERPVKLF